MAATLIRRGLGFNLYSRKIKIGDKQVSKGELLQKNEVRMIYLLNIQKNLNKMRDEIQQKEFETL